MTKQKVLLPFNFKQLDQKALAFVAQSFTGQTDLKITLFHAYTPPPELGKGDAMDIPVMSKMRERLMSLHQEMTDQETALIKAVEFLVENGFPKDRVHHIFRPRKKDIASEIVKLVKEGRYQVVVLNHKPGKITRLFTGSTFYRVVGELKGVTACIVT